MASPNVNRKDLEREIERLRKAVERDPEKYGSLQLLIDNWEKLQEKTDGEYDPQDPSIYPDDTGDEDS